MNYRQRRLQRSMKEEFENVVKKKYKLSDQDLEKASSGNYKKSNVNSMWLGFKLYHETTEADENGKGTFVISSILEGGKFNFKPSPRIHGQFSKGVEELNRLHELTNGTFSLWKLVKIVREEDKFILNKTIQDYSKPEEPEVSVGDFLDKILNQETSLPEESKVIPGTLAGSFDELKSISEVLNSDINIADILNKQSKINGIINLIAGKVLNQ